MIPSRRPNLRNVLPTLEDYQWGKLLNMTPYQSYMLIDDVKNFIKAFLGSKDYTTRQGDN